VSQPWEEISEEYYVDGVFHVSRLVVAATGTKGAALLKSCHPHQGVSMVAS
jgi:hypothetical protein